MATRVYDFITGIETSDAPTAGDPTLTGDIMNLGYADRSYARRRDFGWTTADYTALKAIGTTGDDQRYDGQTREVLGTKELWTFDADSSATEDGSTILQPTSGTGRWHLLGGSGGGGSSSSGFESLTQKLELDYQTSFQTEFLDNSLGQAFIGEDYWAGITGSLLDNDGVSGSTGIAIAWNARTVNDSSLNIDATTNWTALNAGTTLTASSTAGDFKVGTAGLKFDKDGSNVSASIRYDRGSQNLSLSAHWRMFFWVKIPSLTNFTNVYAEIYADTTSNFARWNLTSNYAGQAFVVGWNLCFVDLSTTPSSTGGTSWSKATLSRYVELGVTTSSAGQTYTGIIFDSLYFSLGDVTALGAIGKEHTIFNTSTKQNIILDIGNVSGDGFLSLASGTPLTAAYNGGLTSSNGFIQRSTLKSISGTGKSATFDSNFSSGTVATSQEYRASATLRESQSGNFTGFVDYYQPDTFKVASISSNNVSGIDYGNVSANNLSGDSYDWFRPYFSRENVRYIYLGNKVITANTTYDSTNSYINLPLSSSTGVSGGDILARRSITSSLSVSALAANESFQSFTEATSPNGIQLINESIPIPQRDKLVGWFKLGGINNSEATKNRATSLLGNFTTTPTSLTNPINYNEFYATGFSNSTYFLNSTTISEIDGVGERVQFLMWVNFPSVPTTASSILGCLNTSTFTHGWYVNTTTSLTSFILERSNSGATTTNTLSCNLQPNKWYLMAGAVESSVAGYFYLGGAYSTTGGAGAISSSGNTLVVGGNGTIFPSAVVRVSNLLLFKNSSDLSYSQLQSIENNGNLRPWEFGATQRNKYQLTGQSGQNLGMKVSASKNTTLVNGPYIKKFGVIKT